MKLNWNIFTCKHYTELSSKSLDSDLNIKEKIVFYLHHIICTFCRRTNRQLISINKGLAKIVGSQEESVMSEFSKKKLVEVIKRNIN